MKKVLLLFFFISTTFVGRGQNLVPNGDFELYSGCPNDLGQLDSVLYWINPTTNIPFISGTPDYFNQCGNPPLIDVPKNNFGYQIAHSGGAYSGILVWFAAGLTNYREYVEVPLTSPLQF
jgi:hypothetical protein